jgi:hypothetical protein
VREVACSAFYVSTQVSGKMGAETGGFRRHFKPPFPQLVTPTRYVSVQVRVSKSTWTDKMPQKASLEKNRGILAVPSRQARQSVLSDSPVVQTPLVAARSSTSPPSSNKPVV